MSVLALSALVLVLAVLAIVGWGPGVVERLRPKKRAALPAPIYDPGRELRAERRARDLMRSVIGERAGDMYADLGFISVLGAGGKAGSPYAYLIYPHRPILAYDTESGELLSEYCVEFPDASDAALGSRLPDADDVVAKWMALRGDERGLISEANLHLPGRQVDPAQVRRDLHRLSEWEARQAS
jgi:hypothetical protein